MTCGPTTLYIPNTRLETWHTQLFIGEKYGDNQVVEMNAEATVM